MTSKAITLEFVIPTVLAIALGVALSIGAVYLIDNYLSSIGRATVTDTDNWNWLFRANPHRFVGRCW
jgi:hypothetical protein